MSILHWHRPLKSAEATGEQNYRVAILIHTLQLDWSTLQINGITETLEACGVEVVGPLVAEWDPQTQAANIQDAIQQEV